MLKLRDEELPAAQEPCAIGRGKIHQGGSERLEALLSQSNHTRPQATPNANQSPASIDFINLPRDQAGLPQLANELARRCRR